MNTQMVNHTLSLQMTLATIRDVELIQELSLEHEKEFLRQQNWPSFIEKLCSLGKSFERSLITGAKLVYDTECFPSRDDAELPQFCYVLFVQLFTLAGYPRYILDDSSTGRLHLVDSHQQPDASAWPIVDASASAVLLLRQVLLLFSKAVDLPVEANESVEIKEFVTRVTNAGIRFPNSIALSAARKLLELLLCPDGLINPMLAQWVDEPFGRHGPGAVAGGQRGAEKWNFIVDSLRIPLDVYKDSRGADLATIGQAEITSKLVVVPKDFRGHRLICAEPKELQFAQQGLLSVFEQIIMSSRLTNRHISLADQRKSFEFCRDIDVATIDLKNASDELSLQLLRVLLPKEVYSIVSRFRSTHVRLPDGGVVKTKTAFTMGNALCFPLETLVFWALSCAAILTDGGRRLISHLTPEMVYRIRMRVFGDDIIVPVSKAGYVKEVLRDAGFVINNDKTCVCSLVRESCGAWWYAGYDCRITKLKYATTLDLTSWTSFMDVLPSLRDNGLFQTASMLEAFCNRVYPTPNHLRVEGKGFDSGHLRYNRQLQRVEYRRPFSEPDNTRVLPGRIGLTAWFCQTATRFLYTKVQCLKYRWVGL